MTAKIRSIVGALAGGTALLLSSATAVGQDTNLQQAKLTAGDASNGDQFGAPVAIDGEFAIIGAPLVDGTATSDGAAYVFRSVDGLWFQQQQLAAATPVSNGAFGTAVAIDGTRIAVGSGGSTGTPGGSGAVHLFTFDGSSWVAEDVLSPLDAQDTDEFGTALALSGDLLVVGAPLHDAAVSNSGAAYIYRFDGSAWALEQKLTVAEGLNGDAFGDAVAIATDTVFIGAPTRTNGAGDAGVVYPFRWDGVSAWLPEPVLGSPSTGFEHFFGAALAAQDARLVVGEYGNTLDGEETGAVHIFRDEGGAWTFETTLTASDANGGDRFGFSVALDGDILVAGGYLNDDKGVNSGTAYIFRDDLGLWTQETKMTANDGAAFDFFGIATAVSGDIIICGATFDDDAGSASGSAYVYNRFPVVISDADCNGNGINDLIDMFVNQTSSDCNGNGIPDECDISAGTSEDMNGNGIPDECELVVITCPGDANGDGVVNIADLNILLGNFNMPCDP